MKDDDANSANNSANNNNSFNPKPIKVTIKKAEKRTEKKVSATQGAIDAPTSSTTKIANMTATVKTSGREATVVISPVIKEPNMPIDYPQSYQPAVVHAKFAPNRTIINPERPLTDFPEPAPRIPDYLLAKTPLAPAQIKNTANPYAQHTASLADNCWQKNERDVSKWDLVQSKALYEHLQLLKVGELAKIPKSFYKNTSAQPLLSSLATMQMVEIADIRNILANNPTLTRYGFVQQTSTKKQPQQKARQDIQNSDYADDWEVILYPHRFDESTEVFHTDVMACSIAKHALQQCDQRKTVNTMLSIDDITNAVRSYQLSQCKELPAMRQQLRRTGIYAGHIIIASLLLELEMQIDEVEGVRGQITPAYAHVGVNLSSRTGLFTRYPILSNYYINGWK